MRNSPSGLLPKENLTGALEVWSKMRSCFLQNKHICGLYDTDREVISSGTGRDSISCFLRICGHLTNYFVVFMIGLSRVWFFSEYKLLTQNLEMARKCEARRLSGKFHSPPSLTNTFFSLTLSFSLVSMVSPLQLGRLRLLYAVLSPRRLCRQPGRNCLPWEEARARAASSRKNTRARARHEYV
ncbi:MAG: hypothetical protein E6Q06_01965 [Candidatus Moraniibacteriota bacterium]|nr:MAG: hypothetical protein E6Q06_01965 [Candidatus Moranbacteria bacterium]